uniref:Uncharacterized protein n=1 Tax=Sphaeramia orbicularis TaxID=375764 RepID=A0A673C8U4_9TELE
MHLFLFHLISSAEKLTMVGMKFSLMMMERICFQSVVLSPRSKQMDSRASFTAAGGLAMERTSTRCCFLMDLTATNIRWKIMIMMRRGNQTRKTNREFKRGHFKDCS